MDAPKHTHGATEWAPFYSLTHYEVVSSFLVVDKAEMWLFQMFQMHVQIWIKLDPYSKQGGSLQPYYSLDNVESYFKRISPHLSCSALIWKVARRQIWLFYYCSYHVLAVGFLIFEPKLGVPKSAGTFFMETILVAVEFYATNINSEPSCS